MILRSGKTPDGAEDLALRRAETGDGKVRRFRDLHYGAKSRKVERRIVASVEATAYRRHARWPGR